MQPPNRRKTVKRQNSTDGLPEDDDTSPSNKQPTEMSDVIATSSKKKSIQHSQSQVVKEVGK